MRPICHPNFVYRPASDTARERMRESHRSRLGNLPGHYRVYGVQVPEEFVAEVRRYAAVVASHHDYDAAHNAVLRSKANRWQVPEAVGPWRGPRPQDVRDNMRARAYERMAERGGAQVLGVLVPLDRVDEIRPYALRMALLKNYGRHAAVGWLLDAQAQNWAVEFPALELVRHGGKGYDWKLVEALLEEGMTKAEVADYLGMKIVNLQTHLRARRKAGLTAFSSRVKGRLEWL